MIEDPTDSHPVGMTGRGIRRRRLARFLFVPAIVPAVLIGALFMFPPNMIGPMYTEPPDPLLPAIVIGAGILAYVVGLAWMIRIYRADPEAHRSFWRSRRY
jgi:hypothetical protein